MKQLLLGLLMTCFLFIGCADDEPNCNGIGYANLNNYSSYTQVFYLGGDVASLDPNETRQLAVTKGVYTVRVDDGLSVFEFPTTNIGECQEKDFTVTD